MGILRAISLKRSRAYPRTFKKTKDHDKALAPRLAQQKRQSLLPRLPVALRLQQARPRKELAINLSTFLKLPPKLVEAVEVGLLLVQVVLVRRPQVVEQIWAP